MKRDAPSQWLEHPQPPPQAEPDATGGRRPALLRSKVPDSDTELAVRCVLDTAERASTATFIYPGIWLAVTLATHAAASWPWLVWGNVLGLGLLAVVRARYARSLPELLRQHPRRAELGFNALSLLSAAYWGCLTAACMWLAPLQPLAWTMLMVTAGMVAAGNTMLGFNPALRYPYPIAMLAPVVVAEALRPLPAHLLVMALQCVFVAYLARSSQLVHQDYWEGRHARRLAEQQARELELASLTDGLTQVPNRMHFDRQLTHEWARQCRRGGHLSVLLVDLDHFKNINDSFGHPFGDTCLQAVAQALQEACGRSTDFVARYGGEEFVVLLPDTDTRGAERVALQMLAQVRELVLRSEALEVRVTCSIGVATVTPRHDKRAADLVQRADNALYAAKHGGRNRLALADTPSDAHSSTMSS
ncbi:GGDEF domain-containing protein [Aquabacterium commune]|uniref:GGDEF domain-containing protein n=1 Tax=Aquabacterium commune TaxID=70586 RepID=UPI001414D431|nr:GGDEF domain-containing protein [Aquabacterium commune]